MSAMFRLQDEEALDNLLKKNPGLRVARPLVTRSKAAAPVRRAPPNLAVGVDPKVKPVSHLELAPAAAAPKESDIERRFAQQLYTHNLPQAERNWYHIPDRMFTLDFAWPDKKIAVEIQGHAHRIRSKFAADIEKRALALLSGWVVMELSGAEVRSGRGIEWFVQLWKQRA
jgi:very-short-patch-repair endonuclease